MALVDIAERHAVERDPGARIEHRGDDGFSVGSQHEACLDMRAQGAAHHVSAVLQTRDPCKFKIDVGLGGALVFCAVRGTLNVSFKRASSCTKL